MSSNNLDQRIYSIKKEENSAPSRDSKEWGAIVCRDIVNEIKGKYCFLSSVILTFCSQETKK